MQYDFSLKDGRIYTLAQLEQVGLSYVLCYPEQPIFSYAALRSRGKQITLDDYRQQDKKANAWTFSAWQSREDRGVQIFTGKTSIRYRDGIPHYLTDFDIEKLFIDTCPQAHQKIISIYKNKCELSEPVVTQTKSGGIRLSAYTPARSKKISFTNQDGDMLLEFFSEDGLSRYDNRYTLTNGCLLDIPFFSKEAAREIYAIAKETGIEKKANHGKTNIVDVDSAGFPENITYNTDGISLYYPIKFCAVTQHKKHPETQGKVQYFKGALGNEKGHCYDCGGWWWKNKPSRRARIKLHKKDTELTLETLDRSRAFLTEVFEKDTTVFGLRADTGVGKNETVIQHVYKDIKLLLNLPHKNLMRELVNRFDDADIPQFTYRGILSAPDGEFPYESPCIKPKQFDTYARKGGNPKHVICSQCQVRATCEEAGHLHDLKQLQKHQVNLFTFPQLFTNPVFKGWIQTNIGDFQKEDLILHDDTEITSLFNIVDVQREYLEILSHQYCGTNTGSFADKLLGFLHKDNLYQNLQMFIEGLSDTERYEIIEGLSHVRIEGQLQTLDEAVESGHFKIDIQSELDALPQVADSEWNLVSQLELFFGMYPNAANAPIQYHEGVLSFALAPILPNTDARIGFMGATLQEEHLKRAFPARYYPNVLFFNATSTKWHPDARVFQLATNRNPRRTVLTDGKLNTTGESYWQSVIELVSRLGGKHGIITYKSVIEEKQPDIETHGLTTAHFGALTGLDNRFEDADFLHILFSPERPPFAHQWDTKMIYGYDEDPILFDRNDTGDFIDHRAQTIYDAGAIAELIQAVGRVRLVIKDKKVFIWCSHYLPTITDRDQTYLFTECDIQHWKGNTTDKLEKFILKRQKTRAEIKTAEQIGDTKTLQEITGISERTARRKTEQYRHENKKEKKARAKALDEQDIPIENIIDELDISRRTFFNWKNKSFR